MLLPTEVDLIWKEWSYKRDLIWSNSSSGSKIVFALFTKFIILHVGLPAIDVRELSLDFVPERWSTFSNLEKHLDDLVEVFLAISVSARILGSGRQSLRRFNRSPGGPGLFDPRVFLWSLLFDPKNNGPVGTSEAWFLHAKQLYPWTEVISTNRLADALGIKILELQNWVAYSKALAL